MSKKVETGLIIVKDNIFSKIKKYIFSIFLRKEAKLLEMISEIEKPKNTINSKIIIPKEIKRY